MEVPKSTLNYSILAEHSCKQLNLCKVRRLLQGNALGQVSWNRSQSTNFVGYTLKFEPKWPILPKYSVLPVSDENFEKTKWPTNWCYKFRLVVISISAGNRACGIWNRGSFFWQIVSSRRAGETARQTEGGAVKRYTIPHIYIHPHNTNNNIHTHIQCI